MGWGSMAAKEKKRGPCATAEGLEATLEGPPGSAAEGSEVVPWRNDEIWPLTPGSS